MRGSLRDLRRRLRAIRRVMQVTQALERVSAVRVLRSRAVLADFEPYARHLREVVRQLAAVADERPDPWCRPAAAGPRVVLVLGPDRGLCGGLPALLAAAVEQCVRTHPDDRAGLWIVGKTVRDRVRRLGLSIEQWHRQPGLAASEQVVGDLVRDAMRSFQAGTCRSVQIVHARWEGGLRYAPKVERLLPLEASPSASRSPPCSYEPAAVTLLEELLPEWLRAEVMEAFLHSVVCEHTARNNAMARATDNARTMLRELNVEFHRLRQEAITAEMAELAAGASTAWPQGA